MKAKIELDLKPFRVPNFVVYGADDDGNQKDSVPLQRIPVETLEALCKEFVVAVYKKAGQKHPPQFISQG